MNLPPEQKAIRAKCFHPSGEFVEFPIEDVESSIPARFEKIVRMYPDRIAVKTRDEAVTYAQLNAMANRLAHSIVDKLGNEAEAVAILVEKGPWLMAAVFAVLKAGKFFVLLDPSFPIERNSAILEETSPHLVVVDAKNASTGIRLANGTLRLFELASVDRNANSDDRRLAISPGALSYVIYTSGSTGKPKGVIQTHRNRLRLVMSYTNFLSLAPDDRCALLTSGTANTIANSLFALLNGSMLCPLNVNELGLEGLSRHIIYEKITVCAISAPLFRQFCATLTGKEQFSDLRILRLTSEASYKSDFDLYKQFFPRTCSLANQLSPTETGILTQILLNHDTQIPGDDMPVGYAADDTEILLLDDLGQEVGFNKVGEIVVRSRYLSPGYWRRPELTEEKFKLDPHDLNKRLYFTGDLGLMLFDGCLFHKGRKDFRVKIRGYGVEIKEVENILRSHAVISECVVVGRRNESEETRLVCYYTAEGPLPPNLNVSELRSFLKERLPDYMIPSVFVRMEALPLTPNGKIDRRALPEPEKVRPELATVFKTPRNEIERELVSIWEDILDVRPIGIEDDFFELGGHSLSATRVLSQILKHLKVEIPLQSLFESPTITGLALLIAQSSGNSAAMDPETEDCDSDFSLRLGKREGDSVLSYSQQRLWFLDQLEPGGCTYNLFSAYRLKGELNITALEASFNEIIGRHEILRTVFKAENGKPVPVVLPASPIDIPIVDLRSCAFEENTWSEAKRVFKEEAQKPFDLARGPLLRITLLQLADDEHVLLRAMHHIVYDGWSEGVLYRELSQIYEALLNERAVSLEELPAQYADYAKWQKQWIDGGRFESQLSYWKKRLDGIGALQLPTYRVRKPLQSRSGGRRYFAIPDGLSSDLRQLSRKHGVTLFMTFLAAFQTLLHRYSGQTDIAIGSPVAGRGRREFEGLIGFFLNLLVLRLDLSGNPTFAETLGRVREMCLGALGHQELPFEKLVEELQPERDLSHNPLFQVTFAFQNTPRVSLRLPGITLEELDVEAGIARFDLQLFIEEEVDGHLKGIFDYDTNLFDLETIDRMNGHFQTLLEGIVADPTQRIDALPILTKAETQQLLVEWNDTESEYPKDESIHELFERQVEKTPNAIALVFEDEQLTYGELNKRANQLAHYLKKYGVGPDELVGLCLERSIEMVVALLAVLKAGGAYVPLDSTYPPQRLTKMFEDAGSRLLLTQEQFQHLIPTSNGACICLDNDWNKVEREITDNLCQQLYPDNIAYMIYTSGSTGQPKGAMNTHKGLSNRIHWMQVAYQLSQMDRVLQKTPYTFDVSVWEFFWPLTTGARLVVAQPGGHRDSRYLIDLIQREQITTLHFVPSMLRQFVEEPGIKNCKTLRQVICSGEVLPVDLQKRFFEAAGARLHNLYGPTEAAIDVTYWECQRGSESVTIPIGRPIANVQIYILDGYLQPVPIGVTGELYIGGVGMARGYLNRPELTAEKFIPNPFSTDLNDRLYKTGDLARYLPNGNIEFLGRIDNQVKIRGFRIELGEIEAVLGQHPGVRQAVVVVREDNPGDRRLVAYVVGESGTAHSSQELRRHVQQKLPEYMVPSAYVFLDSLPLTPNGKVDRKALPEPEANRPELDERFVAPRTPTEQLLAQIWTEVLKIENVGVHDNFFDLGGHSLLATQVVSRACDTFQLKIPLRSLFMCPTVGGVAEQIELAEQVRDTQDKIVTPDKLAKIVAELESMSEDEAQKLAKKNRDQKPRH